MWLDAKRTNAWPTKISFTMWTELPIRWAGRQRTTQISGVEPTKLASIYVWAPRSPLDASKQWANYRTKSNNCHVNSIREINGWVWSPKSVIKDGAAHRGPFRQLQWLQIVLEFRQKAKKQLNSLRSNYFRAWDDRPGAVAVISIGHGITFEKLGKLFNALIPFLQLIRFIPHLELSLADEGCYPYNAASTNCKVHRKSTLSSLGCELPTKVPRDHLYRVGPAYSLNNETDIMIEIFESGPVQGEAR